MTWPMAVGSAVLPSVGEWANSGSEVVEEWFGAEPAGLVRLAGFAIFVVCKTFRASIEAQNS